MARQTQQIAAALMQLLAQENAHSHEDLCLALNQQGYNVTQSTISRLLRKLGAVKGLNAQQETVYLLPKERPVLTSTTDLHKLVVSITHNEQLIMINTTPGSASMIARLLDINHASCQILGTIAGDDAVLVVPTSVKKLKESLQLINDYLFK